MIMIYFKLIATFAKHEKRKCIKCVGGGRDETVLSSTSQHVPFGILNEFSHRNTHTSDRPTAVKTKT